MNERVSIQVLNSNRVGELDILLTSLISQSYEQWDLIILDESQTPVINHKHINDLITFIKCRGHGVIYKYQVAIYNIGKNRNECFKNDKFENEIIIRIDDDSLLDKDYIRLLVETYKDLKSKGVKVGAVGGIVPLVGAVPTYKNVPEIFNKVELDKEGNIIKLGDDGGFDYLEDKVVESHHLRSSFLFTRESFKAVNGHPLEYGFNGYREETDFSFKLIMIGGYKLFTRTGAKCYHLQAGGGSRNFSQEQYSNLVRINDEHFRKKVKYWFEMYGNPFIVLKGDNIDPELLKFKGISKETKLVDRKKLFEEFEVGKGDIIKEVLGDNNDN